MAATKGFSRSGEFHFLSHCTIFRAKCKFASNAISLPMATERPELAHMFNLRLAKKNS